MDEPRITQYDEIMQTRELQMLKTIIPYLGARQQTQMAMCVQFLELRRSMQMMKESAPELVASSLPEGTDRRTALLNELRPFCTQKEQESIDMLLNIFCIMENYEMFL